MGYKAGEQVRHQRTIPQIKTGLPASPATIARRRALDTYLGSPSTGPLFLADNAHRLSYSTAYALTRRLAKRAAIPAAEHVTPHSLRHAFAPQLLATGVPLQDVQDAMRSEQQEIRRDHPDPTTALLHQAVALVHQAIVLLEDHQDDADAPSPPSPAELARIEKVGKIAHLHLAFMEAHDGTMTVADSRDLRRKHYGDKMRATANLFGKKGEKAIMFRLVDYGTRTKPDQKVCLTEEGERLAQAYRQLHVL